MTIHQRVVGVDTTPFCRVTPAEMEAAMGNHGLRRCPRPQIEEALRLGEQLTAGKLARPEVVMTVDQITRMTIWVWGDPIEGLYLIIPLTGEGREAVETNTYNPADPAIRHIAPANTPIYGLYVGVYAGATKDARRAIMSASANVRVSLYAPVPCYARGATEDGARSMLSLGFRPLEGGLPDLFVFDPLI